MLTAIGAVAHLSQIEGEAITPLATRRIIPGDKMMIVHWRMKGADSAAHHHPHEQLVYVISGKLKLRVGDAWHVLGPGGVVMIPGGVVHQADVLEDTEVVDIFFATGRTSWAAARRPTSSTSTRRRRSAGSRRGCPGRAFRQDDRPHDQARRCPFPPLESRREPLSVADRRRPRNAPQGFPSLQRNYRLRPAARHRGPRRHRGRAHPGRARLQRPRARDALAAARRRQSRVARHPAGHRGQRRFRRAPTSSRSWSSIARSPIPAASATRCTGAWAASPPTIRCATRTGSATFRCCASSGSRSTWSCCRARPRGRST